MATLRPVWGELAVHLAISTGLRWSEQFALSADDIDDTDTVQIRVDWQLDPTAPTGAGNRLARPKGGKVRRILLPVCSPTGYPVTTALRTRAAAARTERDTGRNPKALLFPNIKGSYRFSTAFHKHVLTPACLQAGWTYQEWDETKQVRTRTGLITRTTHRRQFDHTWHSLRHRFARFAIDELGYTQAELTVVGGWENTAVVTARYYRTGEEHRASATAKARTWTPHRSAQQPTPPATETVTEPEWAHTLKLRLATGEITVEAFR